MTQTPIAVVLKSDETDTNGDDRVSFFSRGDHRVKHEQSFFRKVTVKEAGYDELMISY